ncbi:MAG: hypothetical protein FJ395_15795 [Verrucomicrobia bacterium]|nr:hypothetical protein [Verrucomicrobiota bacterium]
MTPHPSLRTFVLLALLASTGVRAGPADWLYNGAFANWMTSNAGNRYHTFTPEAADKRAAEIAAAGFKAAITSGYHFRLNFASRDADIRRIARVIADACHKHGLKVIEHHDWTIHFYDAYPLVFEHPDWLQLNAEDMLTRHRIFCLNNPEFQEAYLDYLRRYQRETNTDAYQLDEIQYLSREYCGCRHCRAKHVRDTKRSWPPTHDPAFWAGEHTRADYRDWMHWRARSLGDFRARIGRELRKIRPDVAMFDYTTMLQSNPGGFNRGAMIEERGFDDDTFGTEVNSAPFASHPFVYATLKSRQALGEAHGKPIWAKLEYTQQTAYFTWAFGQACRCSLWGGLAPVEDRPAQEKLLKWPHQMDQRVARSAADIGLFLSRSTRDSNPDPDHFYHEFEGWLQALCLTHNDTRVLLESRWKPGMDLSSLKLIILPNVTVISSEQRALLMSYVENGGRLLLTACADGWPVRRVGKGQILHRADKLGPLAFENQQMPTSIYRSAFKPPKDPRAIEQIGATVEKILAGVPRFRIEGAPRGLLAPIYRDGTRRIVHLLNASGRALKPGDGIDNPKRGELPMPALPAMTLHLPGQVSSAVLATPERPDTIPLEVGAGSTIKVPAGSFRTYGVVYAYE